MYKRIINWWACLICSAFKDIHVHTIKTFIRTNADFGYVDFSHGNISQLMYLQHMSPETEIDKRFFVVYQKNWQFIIRWLIIFM